MARFIGFGSVQRSPEILLKGKSPYCSIAVCVQLKGSIPLWVNITVWGTKGKRLAENAQAGDQIYFDGVITVAENRGEKYFTMKPDSVELVSRKELLEPERDTTVTKSTQSFGSGDAT